MSKKPILSALVLVAAAYVASPYVALYRLQAALSGGDRAKFAGMIDWDSVRAGLKQDVSDQLMGEPPAQPKPTAQLASTELPPFGASFMRGVASHVIDETVTPDAVTGPAVSNPAAGDDERGAEPLDSLRLRGAHVSWAFFQSPETFTLWLRPRDSDPTDDPIKLRLELTNGAWKITRVWLPESELRHNN